MGLCWVRANVHIWSHRGTHGHETQSWLGSGQAGSAWAFLEGPLDTPEGTQGSWIYSDKWVLPDSGLGTPHSKPWQQDAGGQQVQWLGGL